MTILRSFIDSIQNPSHETDLLISSVFCNQVEVLQRIEHDIRSSLADSESVSKCVSHLFPLNPYKFSSNANDALSKLERCVAISESHIALKKEVTLVIEKLLRMKTVTIMGIEHEIETLSINKPKEGDAATYDELIESANHSVTQYSLAKNTQQENRQSYVDPKDIDTEFKMRSAQYDNHNSDVVREHVRAMDIVNRKRALKASESAVHTKEAQLFHAILQKQKVANEQRRDVLRIEQLKTRHKAELDIFHKVLETYSKGGALDIAERFERLWRYFIQDFTSAIHSLKYVNQGAALILGKKFDTIDLSGEPNIVSLLTQLRSLIDEYNTKFSNYNRTTLMFNIDELIPPDSRQPCSFDFPLPTSLAQKEVLIQGMILLSAEDSLYSRKSNGLDLETTGVDDNSYQAHLGGQSIHSLGNSDGLSFAFMNHSIKKTFKGAWSNKQPPSHAYLQITVLVGDLH